MVCSHLDTIPNSMNLYSDDKDIVNESVQCDCEHPLEPPIHTIFFILSMKTSAVKLYMVMTQASLLGKIYHIFYCDLFR